jgi:hypothetical protein
MSTKLDFESVKSLESSLIAIFNSESWTPVQQQTYQLIKNYTRNLQEDSRKAEIKEDISIIRNNFKDQPWFINSKSKPVLSYLLDSMSLVHYTFEQNEYYISFMIVLSFQNFEYHVCFYQNKVNHFSNFYIYFVNAKNQKAYLTFYTNAMGTEATTTVKKLQLPEFNKIYQVTGLDAQMFSQYDFLIFFTEIAMYYDESGLIGDIQIGHGIQATLNQLIAKFNTFIQSKTETYGYKKP